MYSVYHEGEKKNACKILVGKRPLGNPICR
jgi:hypothetical protein